MKGTNSWMSALTIIVAAAFGEVNIANQVLAQEFGGTDANVSDERYLPPPARPEDAARQQLDSAGEQLDAAAQRLDTGQQLDAAGPYLGITFDPEFSDSAVARSVAPGGPAEQAGIQPGDTIEAINDRPVSSYHDAYEIVEAMRPGEIIDIDFSRRLSGRTQAVIGRRPVEDLRTVDYAPDVTSRGALNRADGSAVYAPLPPPPRFDDRSRPLPDYSDRLYREPSYDWRVELRQEELRRDNRASDPRRGGERGFRSRPLLPWRRN
jgi:membrane-associated protease RseP (regulator of RpoE activity)